jgi:hypothetical protein
MDIEWKMLRAELPEAVQKRLDTRRDARRREKPDDEGERPNQRK